MNEKNRKERKAAKIAFIIQFSYVLLLFLLFGICTLITARKGISTLEEKKALYDDIFRKQADYNFRMDDMFRNMNSLSTKERSGNEHRQLQLIITQERDKMLDEINGTDADSINYALYKSILEQISTTQDAIDRYDREARRRAYNLGQLQKGRRKLR
ncbi:hypothetical protein [Segatella oris]|jgi:hypothetical protein|uniref:Uncharacterized protein n=3 Tax=Segatella oris TaxID=28135 RepID=D1QW35_9BACT|nr:hypothetical protein [Segatella oris]EFB30486.1 hypothetical protein HMPREF0971_03230 [Segatella oris F0302]EFI47612.1 hypothetical protein HMPREF0665_02476 [Segatella oris C735]OFP38296.1 hypothetical protein HMPREF2992_00540 [Prevotella sp. HMSC069G02]VEH16077.1 Uncharacterised protein [Segatella oris]